MRYIKLRWYFDLLKVLRCVLKNEDYCIVIDGWKREGLIPAFLEANLKADITNREKIKLNSTSTKLSFLSFIIGMYFGPIFSFIETETDRGKVVIIDCDSPATITIKARTSG